MNIMAKDRPYNYLGVSLLGEWRLRLYVMRAVAESAPSSSELEPVLGRCLGELRRHGLTEEYEYAYAGWVIFHFGRRGISIAVWHWAEWSTTWELFCRVWYAYGSAIEDAELLDAREPILCHYDWPVIESEVAQMRDSIAACDTLEDIRERYCQWRPSTGD